MKYAIFYAFKFYWIKQNQRYSMSNKDEFSVKIQRDGMEITTFLITLISH